MPPRTQFPRDGTEDARAFGHAVFLDDDAGVVVEADAAAVLATRHLTRAHHHRRFDGLLANGAARSRFFDDDNDHIADACVASLAVAEHADAHGDFSARIISHREHGLLLDHDWATEEDSASFSSVVFLFFMTPSIAPSSAT